jgi:hypothetical protein
MENTVAKNKNKTQQPKEKKEELPVQPWISMRRGLIVMAVTSVTLAVWIASQVIPATGWLEGILWGLLFGGMIWAIFFGNILINKFLRRR